MIDLSGSKEEWPLAILIRRIIWTFFLEPAVRWLPKFANPLRILALRLMGAQIEKSCLISPGVKVLMPWNLKIGELSAIGRNCDIYNFAPIEIGRHSVISQRTYLCTGSHDYTHPHMPLTWAPITIGSECWIAAEVFVTPGVRIGNGAVVGARSVVTKDVPEWTVATGHPCRPVKERHIKA